MCAKKKKESLFRVEGFEQWMDQFLADPYASFHYPSGIRVDLFETETEYIIEADLPDVEQQHICVQKEEAGLCILVAKQPEQLIERHIQLPIDMRDRLMNASLECGLLSIHISKSKMAPANEHTIRFTD
ncbi:Hsp20/alpha crystallin family protein [Ectobacillus ponti]|uniref:Hsp20/alpha crystallin family protein n=1 Tax=Ectobacillus ponti TaxID=2961894 RepID=A0AA41X926_9BACI|nr:Hsp20/alpha crystallin family protein [Ectobacillus ponti]MCP8969125.1 Hsp20/alpha crystallin family protein [Ectobacillus ponti]